MLDVIYTLVSVPSSGDGEKKEGGCTLGRRGGDLIRMLGPRGLLSN